MSKEQRKKYNKTYRDKNPEKIKELQATWRGNNKDKIKVLNAKNFSATAQKQRRRNEKAYLIALAGGRCIKCGYNKSQWALSFHHTDPNEKDGNISNMTLKNAIEELKKCILLCANCHYELHEKLEFGRD